MTLEKEAFTHGVVTGLLASKVDPEDVNTAVGICKCATVLPLLAASGIALTPAIAALLFGTGSKLVSGLGSAAGSTAAGLVENAADPATGTAAKEKILRDYQRQIKRLKVQQNNKLVSQVMSEPVELPGATPA